MQGSYTCECPPGFRIGDNRRACIDVNECRENPGQCGGGQTCMNTYGGYACVTGGFSGGFESLTGAETSAVGVASGSIGATLGIVLAVIVTVINVAIVTTLVIRRHRRRKLKQKLSEESQLSTPHPHNGGNFQNRTVKSFNSLFSNSSRPASMTSSEDTESISSLSIS